MVIGVCDGTVMLCLFLLALLSSVFLSLSILLVMLTEVASIDGVDTPSGNLPLYFSLCLIIVLLSGQINSLSLSLSALLDLS